MIQGTTPTHIFVTDFETSLIQKVEITYQQNCKNILQKTEKDCVLENKEIRVSLTQEETLLFKEDVLVNIQIRIKSFAGNVSASTIMVVNVEEVLSKEIL